MKSREEELAGKVRQYLDQATNDLRPGLAYRLQQARAQALARLGESPQGAASGRLVGAHGLLGAGAGGADLPAGGAGRPVFSAGRLWVGAGVLALALLGWQQWTAWQELAELEEVDAQILTSDLPIDAFVDRGFQLFLTIAPKLVDREQALPAADESPGAEASAEPSAEEAAADAAAPETVPTVSSEPADVKPAQ